MLKTPRYVIAVKDLNATADYFEKMLGFTIHKLAAPGWQIFERDQVSFLAGDCPNEMSAHEIGDHSYIAYIGVEAVDALYDEFQNKGVEFVKPIKSEAHGMREFGIRTLDGHRMMFGQPI